MKVKIRQVGDHAILYRDNKTGIAWIEDGSCGLGFSVHPNIDVTGSVIGMKHLGYWGKHDKTVRCHGFIYNISRFVIDPKNKWDMIVKDECNCQCCIERRAKENDNLKTGTTSDIL